MSRFLWFTV